MLSEGTAWTDVSAMKTATQKLSGKAVMCQYKLLGIVKIYSSLTFILWNGQTHVHIAFWYLVRIIE